MKKSAFVQLVLVATVTAACQQQKKENEWEGSTKKKVYMRSDTSASYARTHFSAGRAAFFIFRPYGQMGNMGFRRTGYYSDAIPHQSNTGRSSSKSAISRGGFGRSGFSSSSS
jgi:hypothetical protein